MLPKGPSVRCPAEGLVSLTPMDFRAEPVRRPREQVEKQLREAIFSATFKRGERLPSEAQLAKEFRVSRSTVREALRALAAERLITKLPGATGGSFVETVDHESLGTLLSDSMETILKLGSVTYAEVADIRQMLEVPAAQLAAGHRTEEHVAALEAVINRERLVEVDDPVVPELDINFHSLIATASGNRMLFSFVSALHRVTRPVHYIDLDPEAGAATVRQHRAIVAAIAAGDPDAAGEAMAAHLTYLGEMAPTAVAGS